MTLAAGWQVSRALVEHTVDKGPAYDAWYFAYEPTKRSSQASNDTRPIFTSVQFLR